MILIVDDSARSREPLAALLKREGFEVIAVSGGGEALNNLADAHNDIELVLLDINMPDLDGIATLKVIRKNPSFRDLPVILLTGRHDPHTVVQASKLSVRDYVLKSSLNLSDLVCRIRTRILEHKLADEDAA